MTTTTSKIAFLGGTRYRQPLDATNRKKFRALKSLGELFVIGFSQSLFPRRFIDEAHFFLLPKLPLSLWLIFRHRVDVLVAQSPYEGFPAAWAKKISSWLGRKVALIVESHGDFEESVFMQRRVLFFGFYRLFMCYAARFAFKNADALRVISNSTKHQVDRWTSGKPMVKFPTWTDIDVFLQTVMNKEANRLQDIVYVGVLIPRKGIHHLLNAFVQVAGDFPRARLMI